MPEYLAPGVYVEETSYRAKSIEGVATSTAGFVGQCRFGPTRGKPLLVTSFEEFRRRFGGLEELVLGAAPRINYLAFAVAAFFENGGKRVYVSRVFEEVAGADHRSRTPTWSVTAAGDTATARLRARYPGAIGDMRVEIKATRGRNRMTSSGRLVGLRPGDVVEVNPAETDATISVRADLGATLRFARLDDLGEVTLHEYDAAGSVVDRPAAPGDVVRPVSLSVRVFRNGEYDQTYADLSTHPESASAIGTVLREHHPYDEAGRAYLELEGFEPRHALVLFRELLPASATDVLRMEGGSDGQVAASATWNGSSDLEGDGENATGIQALGEIDDIAVVAAPGSSELDATEQQAVRSHLIGHCEQLRYRFAILAAGPNPSVQEIRDVRAKHDSKYAALYYPYVVRPDPFGQRGDTIELPPEGFMAGIYARSDIERGVHKAPANEVVQGALRFSRNINSRVQDVLNPDGINCLRFFEGRGYRCWGARTISSDPEWKYLNVRRLFIYLEHSIDKATQWAVFEPNNEQLWLKVRMTIELFLIDVWRTGALMGTTPDQAFFVKCDRTTMTQGDLDNGRLVCLIGVAPTKPAEYVVFRIGQWTADASIV
ncbi:MAG: phage tail sheath family protein [Myxococcales bacterium]|nr:phage tail sheath family protein [Myxococcales bacterium]